MRFLVDECVGPTVARFLSDEGHEVLSLYNAARGADDDDVLNKQFLEQWILVTADGDFGAKVYREQRPHWGIVYLQLADRRPAHQIAVLGRLLARHSGHLAECFVAVTEDQVRLERG